MNNPAVDAAAVADIVTRGRVISQSGNQGSIHAGAVDGRQVLVKAVYGNFLTMYLRRKMLLREYRAYRRLEGIAGIPRCYGLFDGRYLALEYIDAPTYRLSPPVQRESFFRRLLEIIRAMHDRGVAHGDLMRKSNILVKDGEYPYVIDFGVAEIYRPGLHPFNHWLHGFLWQHDFNAWLKHKYGREFDGISPEDAALYKPILIDRIARVFKRMFITPFQRRN